MIRGKIQVACIAISNEAFIALKSIPQKKIVFNYFEDVFSFCQIYTGLKFKIIIAEGTNNDPLCLKIKKFIDKFQKDTPFTVLVQQFDSSVVKTAVENGISELFIMPLDNLIINKIELLTKSRKKITKANKAENEHKIIAGKRVFDIIVSSSALLVLSPVFLLIGIFIRLESKGPVLYYSLRVGTGYKIFRFYKFRSMYVNADEKLSQLKHLNQYAKPTEKIDPTANFKCEDCKKSGNACSMPLYADKKIWCEKNYSRKQKSGLKNTFLKIKNDPRITHVGNFIRNTSLDELPQLWNVLKGDMSIVGNRPLPLYEAENLTTDNNALRFMAPAGITGLWQVSKRGKGEMSEEERIGLDNDYAKSCGFFYDMKLILKTFPALFQKENV